MGASITPENLTVRYATPPNSGPNLTTIDRLVLIRMRRDRVAARMLTLVANLSVQNVNIRLSQVSEHVQTLVRQYDCRQARVEIYRGLFDPDSRQMVAPAECRFVGFVDTITINTPSENEEGSVTMVCASHTQEMTRSNPSTRSHATQVLRQAGDAFYTDADTSSEWEFFWGSEKGKVATQKKRKKLFGIF